jgi:hypothetical protein
MTQTLHLLILNRDRSAALARSFEARSLLPMIVCDERMRGSMAASRWLSTSGINGTVIGQWLGRAGRSGDTVDWLVVVSSSGGDAAPTGLRWQSLKMGDSIWMCDYQRWAIERTGVVAGSPATTGPFGNVDWLKAVTSWVEAETAAAVRDVVPYKTTSYEVVLRLSTCHGDVFFKGLSSARASEAHLTSALGAICPAHFAQTLALDVRPDGTAWWLTGACPGASLSSTPTPESVARVATAYTAVQKHIAACGLSRISPWCPVLEIEEPMSCIGELIGAKDIAHRCRDRLQSACEAMSDPRIDISWIPLDIAPSNILLHGDAVRFIDLDESFMGPAPLALAMLARRLGANRGRGPCEVIASVLEAWLGWRRVRAMTAREEVVGVPDIARHRLATRLVAELTAIN